MRKIVSFALMLVMVAGFSVCQAISPDRINAGGIYPFQSLQEVVSIYGQPVSVKKEEIRAGFKHTNVTYQYGRYGTTFDVTFVGNKVMGVHVAGNNGIATSDGIKVGTPLSEVKRILGKGGEVKTPDGRLRISYSQDLIKDPIRSLMFFIKNNKVESYIVHSGVAY